MSHAHSASRIISVFAALAMTIGVIAAATPASAEPINPAPVTIPELTSWAGAEGTLTLPDQPRVVIDAAAAENDLNGRTGLQEAQRLIDDLRATGVDAQLAVGAVAGAGDIVLRIEDDHDREGYRLTVADRVEIAASESAGLFYGGRTLLQMLKGSPELPAGETVDAPGVQGLRGGLIDAGRKYWEIDYLKDLIRQMSYQKLNMLNLHVVESEGFRLDSPLFPGLADPAVSYDEDEIRDLVAFGNEHHVEIIPGFEFPGHATVVSEYFGIGFGAGANPCTPAHMHSHLTPNWVIDMTSDKAREDSVAVLNEFVPWFDSEYIHLGGDEIPGQLASCPRVVNHIASTPDIGSAGDLLVDYINELNEAVLANGKRSIIFNGFENMSRPQQTLDPSVIIQDWQGEGTNPAFTGHEKLWNRSSRIYLTPNNYHNSYPNIPFLTQQWAPNTGSGWIGSSFSVWADYNFWAQDEFFEQQMGPLRAAVADRAWNVTARSNPADLDARLAALGDAPGLTGFPELERLGADEPRHRYSFEPAPYPSGFTWAGSPGQTLFVEDETGRQHGSTYIIYNPTFVDSGVSGSALSFSHNRQGVGLGGVDLPGPWTMSVWVNQSATLNNATLLSSNAGTAILLRDQTTGNVALQTPSGRVAFNASLPVGQWVALALVDDGSTTALYLNGERVDEISSRIALPLKAIGGWNISLRGLIDELTINDAALTAEQIAERFEEERAALPVPGLVNHWSFDEEDGVARDLVSGNDATLEGATRIAGVHGGGAALPGGSAGVYIGASEISGPWTASLWVKRTGSNSSSTLFAGSTSAVRLEQHNNTGRIGFTAFGVADRVIDYTAPLGEWVSLTFTSNGSTVRAYADGEFVGQVSGSGNLGRTWIGRLASGANLGAAIAEIDDVLFFDRTLSDSEVAALFAGFAQSSGAAVDIDVDLSFAGGDAPEGLQEGDEVSAEINVRNPGLVDLLGVQLTVPGADDCVFPTRFIPADEVTCTLTYVVSDADVSRGTISLIAQATATGANPLNTEVSAASEELTATTAVAADVLTEVTSRTLAGKVYLSVAVTNETAVPLDVVVTTPYGNKSFPQVAPGRSVSASVNTKLTSIPAGDVIVKAIGESVDTTKTVPYGAFSAGG